jgi:Glycosyltransferase
MSKKILFFYQSTEVSGGVDTVMVDLVKAWPDKSDTIKVWLNKGHKGPHLYAPLSVRLKRIDLLTIGDIGPNPENSFQLFLRNILQALWRIFRYPYFLYSLIVFYFELKKDMPDVAFSHNGGYPGGELNCSFVIAAKMAGVKKVILVIHNNAVELRAPFKWADRILDRLIYNSCSKIISVSASCAKQIMETRFPYAEKIDHVYNGIMVERIDRIPMAEKMKRLKLGSGCKVIGCIGDYEERKGHTSLITAFSQVKDKFPGSKLIIIGSRSSPHTIVLRRLIQKLNLESRVLLTGYLDAAWEYIECFDVFVFPSISYESFGMVLLEAMLYKKPIIATNIGGIPEVLSDTGIIVEPDNVQQIAVAIDRVLSSRDLAESMARSGYDRLEKVFQAAYMAEKYYNLTIDHEKN